jgi:hypothetical protein
MASHMQGVNGIHIELKGTAVVKTGIVWFITAEIFIPKKLFLLYTKLQIFI